MESFSGSAFSFFLFNAFKKREDNLSISDRIALDLRDKMAYKTNDGMAAIRPSSVVIRASEIPSERLLASPVPKRVICLKVLIMPVTVPSRPISGAVAAVT